MMRKLSVCMISLLLLGVGGCGKEDTKEVTPTNLEKNFNTDSEGDQSIKTENNVDQTDKMRDISTKGISKGESDTVENK